MLPSLLRSGAGGVPCLRLGLVGHMQFTEPLFSVYSQSKSPCHLSFGSCAWQLQQRRPFPRLPAAPGEDGLTARPRTLLQEQKPWRISSAFSRSDPNVLVSLSAFSVYSSF